MLKTRQKSWVFELKCYKIFNVWDQVQLAGGSKFKTLKNLLYSKYSR